MSYAPSSRHYSRSHGPWNKGRLVGPKPPLKPREVWAIRARLQIDGPTRDLALVSLAIDSKLRGCDLVELMVDDICLGDTARSRLTMVQNKTGRPVQFELTANTRAAVVGWVRHARLRAGDPLFPSRFRNRGHISTRQYARFVNEWITSIGLDPCKYGTHSLRRTKVARIYRKTGNLRAVQLLLGHTKLESTVRYLGIEVEDALEISEQVEL